MAFEFGTTLKETLEKKRNENPHPQAKYDDLEFQLLIDSMLEGYFHFVNELHTTHRDIKPANLFLSENQIKFGDFGIAKHFNLLISQAAPQTIIGTRYIIMLYFQKKFYKNLNHNNLNLLY